MDKSTKVKKPTGQKGKWSKGKKRTKVQKDKRANG